MNSFEKRLHRIDVAMKRRKADLVLKNAVYLNVFSNEFLKGDIAVSEGYFCGIGSYEGECELDLEGRSVVPGFMDGHLHLESSVVSPTEYARAVLPHGTVAVFADPHEIANVLGTKGIDYILDSTASLPLEIYIMISSCVPATKFDESGAVLSFREIKEYLHNERVRGLAEMMNYPGIVSSDKETVAKVSETAKVFKKVDGHAPKLSCEPLNAYVTAGVESDHECTDAKEALEKLRLGQWIMIREGTACRDLKNLISLISLNHHSRCMFVTDDRHPGDLISEGHIDNIIRKAISYGAKPELVYKTASFNTASYFNLHFRGAIAPGYQADFVILDDVNSVAINSVYKRGRLVAKDGQVTEDISDILDKNKEQIASKYSMLCGNTVNIAPLHSKSFALKGAKAKVIGLVPGEILTTDEGEASEADVQKDIIKLCVIERHHATGHIGVCFVKGYGIKCGAIATSVAHDSHNVIVAGTNDEDMLLAVNKLKEIGGGMAVALNGKILDFLALPIAGLMCDLNGSEAQEKLNAVKECAYSLGVSHKIDPFMTLSFTSLAVIPKLRLTSLGVVDVEKFELL